MASSLELASPGVRQASRDFLLPHRSLVLGVFYGEGGCHPGETVWKEAGGFLPLLWAHRDKRCPWGWAAPILGLGSTDPGARHMPVAVAVSS